MSSSPNCKKVKVSKQPASARMTDRPSPVKHAKCVEWLLNQGGRGHKTVNYTSPQSCIIRF